MPRLSQRLLLIVQRARHAASLKPRLQQAFGLFLLLLASRAMLAARRLRRRDALALPVPVALSAVLQLLRERHVEELIYADGGGMLVKVKDAASAGVASTQLLTHLVPGSAAHVFQLADSVAVPSIRFMPPRRDLSQLLSYVILFVMMAAWYKMAKSLVSREEKFSQNRRHIVKDTCLADVVCKNKIELAEIVDYLNHPDKYVEAGARLPRGALLVGPSGTGKTLLAKAVAGEARCAFLTASASEFVEMYVGRGAARVRDLFKQARELAPVVLFLDELDGLGSRRMGLEVRTSSDEYVQTINQLLTELDGFHGRSDGIVVLAATNRREAVDPALLRPGRFDRHIVMELPDEAERLQILRLHSSRAPLAAGFLAEGRDTLACIAADSSGCSGADLANIVNEAVFLALRAQRSTVAAQDFHAALARAHARTQQSSQPSEQASRNGLSQAFFRAWPPGGPVAFNK